MDILLAAAGISDEAAGPGGEEQAAVGHASSEQPTRQDSVADTSALPAIKTLLPSAPDSAGSHGSPGSQVGTAIAANAQAMQQHMQPDGPSSQPLPVYIKRFEGMQHAIWINLHEVLSGQEAEGLFLLTDASYEPVTPHQVVTGKGMQDLVGYPMIADRWRLLIKLGAECRGLKAGRPVGELLNLWRQAGANTNLGQLSQQISAGLDVDMMMLIEEEAAAGLPEHALRLRANSMTPTPTPPPLGLTGNGSGAVSGTVPGPPLPLALGVECAVPVFARKHEASVHALWVNAATVLANRRTTPMFMLCADASYAAAVPQQVLMGSELPALVGVLHLKWKRGIKLGQAIVWEGVTYPAEMNLEELLRVPRKGGALGPLHSPTSASHLGAFMDDGTGMDGGVPVRGGASAPKGAFQTEADMEAHALKMLRQELAQAGLPWVEGEFSVRALRRADGYWQTRFVRRGVTYFSRRSAVAAMVDEAEGAGVARGAPADPEEWGSEAEGDGGEGDDAAEYGAGNQPRSGTPALREMDPEWRGGREDGGGGGCGGRGGGRGGGAGTGTAGRWQQKDSEALQLGRFRARLRDAGCPNTHDPCFGVRVEPRNGGGGHDIYFMYAGMSFRTMRDAVATWQADMRSQHPGGSMGGAGGPASTLAGMRRMGSMGPMDARMGSMMQSGEEEGMPRSRKRTWDSAELAAVCPSPPPAPHAQLQQLQQLQQAAAALGDTGSGSGLKGSGGQAAGSGDARTHSHTAANSTQQTNSMGEAGGDEKAAHSQEVQGSGEGGSGSGDPTMTTTTQHDHHPALASGPLGLSGETALLAAAGLSGLSGLSGLGGLGAAPSKISPGMHAGHVWPPAYKSARNKRARGSNNAAVVSRQVSGSMTAGAEGLLGLAEDAAAFAASEMNGGVSGLPSLSHRMLAAAADARSGGGAAAAAATGAPGTARSPPGRHASAALAGWHVPGGVPPLLGGTVVGVPAPPPGPILPPAAPIELPGVEGPVTPLPLLAVTPNGLLTVECEGQVMPALAALLKQLGHAGAVRSLWARYNGHYSASEAGVREFSKHLTELRCAMDCQDVEYVRQVLREQFALPLPLPQQLPQAAAAAAVSAAAEEVATTPMPEPQPQLETAAC